MLNDKLCVVERLSKAILDKIALFKAKCANFRTQSCFCTLPEKNATAMPVKKKHNMFFKVYNKLTILKGILHKEYSN